MPPDHYRLPGDEIQELLIEFKFSHEQGKTKMIARMDNLFDEKTMEETAKGWFGMFWKLEEWIQETA
jgi:hypothetical protein